MTLRFPPIDPYDSGMIDVGGGHRVYWECCGDPNGKPTLFLHGGPGSGCSPGSRRYFDPNVYRIVLFDQRGCGRSRPLASEPSADLSTNTTNHLIADIEQLRRHLAIDRWTVLGVSWGSTLGLAYAQTHSQRITALILALVTTTTRREVEWITNDVGRIFPQEWERFVASVPERLRQVPLVDAYAALLFDPDSIVREHAAREWCAWESAHISLAPGYHRNPLFEDAEYRLRFARLVTHYWRHAAFLDDAQLVRNAPQLNGIPGVLINGRYDVSGPLETAWRLSQSWTTSQLRVIDDGHGNSDTFPVAVIGALSHLADT